MVDVWFWWICLLLYIYFFLSTFDFGVFNFLSHSENLRGTVLEIPGSSQVSGEPEGGGSSFQSGWAHVGTPAEPSGGEAMRNSRRRAFFWRCSSHTSLQRAKQSGKQIPTLHLAGLQGAFGGVTKLLRKDAVLANTCYPSKCLYAFGLRSSSYTDKGFSCIDITGSVKKSYPLFHMLMPAKLPVQVETG